VANGRANQIADDPGSRLRIAQFAAGPAGGLVVGYLGLLGSGDHPPRVESSDLADDGFDPRGARSDIEDMAARVTGSAEADSISVDHRLADCPIDHVEPVRSLLDGIDVFTQLENLGGKPAPVFLVRRCSQDDSTVALSPSSIVKRDDEVP